MRVLVVEDERTLADDIAEGLRDGGLTVDVAYDGPSAASRIVSGLYDVLVLDRDLPGIHGDHLCELAGTLERPPLVLMLTAAAAPGDRVAGLQRGADDYLGKPFHFPELVLRVRALGRRRPGARPRVMRVGDVELDDALHVVRRGGRLVDVSPTEYRLLAALMRAHPAPLSAERLMDEVWDEALDPFSKAVAVTMGRLRRKLGPPDAVRTLPAVGYVLAAPR